MTGTLTRHRPPHSGRQHHPAQRYRPRGTVESVDATFLPYLEVVAEAARLLKRRAEHLVPANVGVRN